MHEESPEHDPEPAEGTLRDSRKEAPAEPVSETPSPPGFQVVRELGRGAMGVVYEARQEGLNRSVALKMVLSGPYAAASARSRFLIEAEAVASLDHPNIVRVFAFGEHLGHPYLAMDFIAGGTLAERLREGGPLPPREAAAIAVRLASAVAHAHARGVVHRDIKPGNVLMSKEGEPYLTDFGLAKVGRENRQDLTATDAILGTPSYMSPEQAAGKACEVGTHSDVYALGAVLYDLLTGRPPLVGDSQAATLQKVLSAEPQRPRHLSRAIPRDLETICLKCLEKQPGKRYATAQALADDLNHFLAGEPIAARPAGSVERAVKWVRRNSVMAGAMAAVALALLAGTTVSYLKYRDAQEALGVRDEALGQANAAIGRRDEAIQEATQRSRDLQYQLGTGNFLLANAAYDNRDINLASERLALVPEVQRSWEWNYLKRQTEGGIFTLYGHTNKVTTVCFSPDGTRLATGSWDDTARVWDARSGTPLLELKGHTDGVTSVCFSPDGTRLATGSYDKTARVWDARSGTPLLELKGHTDGVWSVCFSPDGTRLATGSVDKTARVWDARSGTPLLELKGHTDGVRSVCFSPDGTRLATGSLDTTARVWDARSGTPLLELKGHTDGVTSVCFSPDGTRLATGSWDKTARVWDARSGTPLLELKGHTDGVTSVCFSPDGTRLATGSWDKTARVWDARSGTPLLELKGHTDGVRSVCFSPDGTRLATGSWDKTARVWDARSGTPLLELKGHTDKVTSVCFSPDGTRLATGSYDKTARVWDARSGTPLLELKGHTDGVTSVCFSPDGTRLATGSVDKTARVWDARSGTPLLELKGHTDGVRSVCFSPDGTRLATGSLDTTARVWDARSGTPLLELKGHTDKVTSVCFSPDGTRLATGSYDKTARVWDARSGTPLLELKGHTDKVTGVCFSPDGTRLATSASDGIRVWNASTGQEIKGEAIPQFMTGNTSYSPDGKLFAHINGNRIELVPADIDPEEADYRLLHTRASYWRYKEGIDAARQANDAFAARFYLDRLLSLPQHRPVALFRERNALASDPRIIARTGLHERELADATCDWAGIQFLAVRGDRLAQRLLAQRFLREGKPGPAVPLLFQSMLARPPSDPPAPPVEELLLAQAYRALKQPEQAKRFYEAAAKWHDEPLRPVRAVNTAAQSVSNPWFGLAAIFAPLNDHRRNPFDWESWLEYDLFRAQLEKEPATSRK